MDAARPGGTLYLCPGTWAEADARAVIGKDLTIVGAGSGDDPATSTILLPGNGRAFDVLAGATVAIRGLRVAEVLLDEGNGGAIRNAGDLTLDDCTLRGNRTFEPGNHGGGIANEERGSLALARCTLTSNTASNGGGIAHTGRGGTLTIVDSTISGNNTSTTGGGIWITAEDSEITISGSTISDNTVGMPGFGVGGGGIWSDAPGSELTIADSTITQNNAARGGGVHNRSTRTVLDGTNVTDNVAYADDAGGGLYQWANEGSIALRNGSTVGGNTGGNCIGSPIGGDGCAP